MAHRIRSAPAQPSLRCADRQQRRCPCAAIAASFVSSDAPVHDAVARFNSTDTVQQSLTPQCQHQASGPVFLRVQKLGKTGAHTQRLLARIAAVFALPRAFDRGDRRGMVAVIHEHRRRPLRLSRGLTFHRFHAELTAVAVDQRASKCLDASCAEVSPRAVEDHVENRRCRRQVCRQTQQVHPQQSPQRGFDKTRKRVCTSGDCRDALRTKAWKWWPRTESNRRHGDFQSPALPTELLGHYRNMLPALRGRAS